MKQSNLAESGGARNNVVSLFPASVFLQHEQLAAARVTIARLINYSKGLEEKLENAQTTIAAKDELIKKQGISQLIQVQKLEHFELFVRKISHDFNNSLTPAIGYTDIIKATTNEPAIAEYADMAGKSTLLAKGLFAKFLAFLRQQPQEKKEVDIGQIIEETLDIMRISIPPSIAVIKNIESKNKIMANPTDVAQIVMNPIVNALHAMESTGGGVLIIELKDLDFNGHYLKLKISDTGIGIPDEIKRKIFEPFFTTKPVGKGTGLGLPVVAELVNKLGGEIKVESEVGKGTSFCINLPIHQQK